MQSNDPLHSFIEPPQLLPSDLQSQLHMLYALTQQQISSSSPSDSKIKRIKYVVVVHIHFGDPR